MYNLGEEIDEQYIFRLWQVLGVFGYERFRWCSAYFPLGLYHYVPNIMIYRQLYMPSNDLISGAHENLS